MGRVTQWTSKQREAFLDHLAGSCNVRASAEMAGVPVCSIYTQRRRDPKFAEDWQAALSAGYDLLETHLVGIALAGERADARRPIETAIGTIDVETALRLLAAHRNARRGKWAGGPPLHRATREQTDAAILRKLAAMERTHGTEPREG